MKNTGETEENDRDSGALSKPLSFIRNGYFSWHASALYNRGIIGSYWTPQSHATLSAGYFYFHAIQLKTQDGDAHGAGFAVRQATNPSPLSLLPAIL